MSPKKRTTPKKGTMNLLKLQKIIFDRKHLFSEKVRSCDVNDILTTLGLGKSEFKKVSYMIRRYKAKGFTEPPVASNSLTTAETSVSGNDSVAADHSSATKSALAIAGSALATATSSLLNGNMSSLCSVLSATTECLAAVNENADDPNLALAISALITATDALKTRYCAPKEASTSPPPAKRPRITSSSDPTDNTADTGNKDRVIETIMVKVVLCPIVKIEPVDANDEVASTSQSNSCEELQNALFELKQKDWGMRRKVRALENKLADSRSNEENLREQNKNLVENLWNTICDLEKSKESKKQLRIQMDCTEKEVFDIIKIMRQ